MSVKQNIADKINQLEVAPSKDLFNKIQKRRSPLYIFNNHLSLHKVRYSLIAILSIVITAGVVLHEDNSSEGMVIIPEISEGKKDMEATSKSLSQKEKETNAHNSNSELESVLIEKEENANDNIEVVHQQKEEMSVQQEPSNALRDEAALMDDISTAKDEVVINNELINEDDSKVELNEKIVFEAHELSNIKYDYLNNPINLDVVETIQIENKNTRNRGVIEFVGVSVTPFASKMHVGNSELDKDIYSNTSQRLSYSVGVHVGMPLYKRWSLLAGLEQTRLSERFKYFKESTTFNTVIDTVVGYIQLPGESPREIERYDTTYINDGNHTISNTKVIRNYIELPIILSYNLVESNKLGVFINSGVRLGILSSSKGKMINAENSLVDLESPANMYSKKLQFSAQLGLDLDYLIGDRSRLFIAPTVRKGLGNLLKGELNANQNYTQFAIQAGLRYNIR